MHGGFKCTSRYSVCVVGVWKTRTVACLVMYLPPSSLNVDDKRVLNVLTSLRPLRHQPRGIDDVSTRWETLVSDI